MTTNIMVPCGIFLTNTGDLKLENVHTSSHLCYECFIWTLKHACNLSMVWYNVVLWCLLIYKMEIYMVIFFMFFVCSLKSNRKYVCYKISISHSLFLFQIILKKRITVSTKILSSTTVFNMIIRNVSWAANQHMSSWQIKMVSYGVA